MAPKKVAGSLYGQIPVAVTCVLCEYLEQQVDGAISHIRNALENRSKNIKEKVQELHKWQECRDEAIEKFYTHKRIHRVQFRNGQSRNAA